MSYFAPMSPNDVWRAKALIAQFPKGLPYNEGPSIHQTMEARYDRDLPSQTVPLSTNDIWRARALIAEFPARTLSSETQPAPRETLEDCFRSFEDPNIFSSGQVESVHEDTSIDRPVPILQSPGEIQEPNMDDLYGRLAEARENYQKSRGGLERAGAYAAESADDFMRALANEATAQWADKIAAGADTIFGEDDYDTNWARQRAQTELASKRSPTATDLGKKALLLAPWIYTQRKKWK